MRFFHNQKNIADMKRGLNIGRMTIPMLRAEHRFQIFVKLITGETITMHVRSSDDTHEVKMWFRNLLDEGQRRIHSMNGYLTYQSKILLSGYKLSDFHIQKDCTLRQSFGLRGGGKRGRASASDDIIPRFIGVPQPKDL